MADELDLIIIGSGPGGYVAAIRAGQLGMKVAVVEKDDKFGGTCLHRGCIPTKALLHTAETLDSIRHAKSVGVKVGETTLDLRKAHAYKRKVVTKNAKGIEFLFKKNQVKTIRGRGRVVSSQEVLVEQTDGTSEMHRTKNIIVATGSVPRELPFAAYDGEKILSSDHALELDRVPGSIAILGAGAVGCEFASIFRSFGSKVTLIEMLPRLLPIEDEEISEELAKAFRKRGIASHVDTRLETVEPTEAGVKLNLKMGEDRIDLETEYLLVAVGRAPVSENLGLEDLGITIERGYVGVNEWMQTSVPNIYAIGDIVDTPWLAHVASSEGILAVEHMAGQAERALDYGRVPGCTYCEPEVASVGLTEAQARDKGYDVAVGKFPFAALAKAAILGKTAGFVKIVRETRYDEVLGVHILGAHATDLIAEACVALQLESTTEEIVRTIHAHPTLSEGLAEAAHAAMGHAIHI